MNLPALGILNETDSPHQMSVVVIFKRGEDIRWAFVAPRANYPKHALYLNPEEFTPLSDFGIACSLAPEGALQLHQLTISVARYKDGRPRYWQGHSACKLVIHTQIGGHVVEAVNAEFARRRESAARAVS